MNELLDKFYKHELLIDIRGANRKELEELENVIDRKFVDERHIYQLHDYAEVNYLHCRDNDPFRGNIEKKATLTYSERPQGYVNRNDICPMKSVSYLELIRTIDISEEEIEMMYK